MIGRLGIALLLIGVGFGAYAVSTRYGMAQAAGGNTGAELLNRLRPGVPAVIYFWSESCPPCKTVQKPALEQLEQVLGPDGVQVIDVNAMEQPGLADGWGVLSLPTTFIVDASGQPRRVNHGIARVGKLREQIETLN